MPEKASFFSRKKKTSVIGRRLKFHGFLQAGLFGKWHQLLSRASPVCCMLYAVFTSATFLFRECPMEPAGKKEKLQTGIPDF